MPAPLVGLAVGAAARAVAKKVAKKAVTKAATKANVRGLKAAQGPSLASKAKKLEASSGKYERNITKIKAETNQILGSSRKEAYTKAAKAMDKEQSQSKKMAIKILKANKAGAKAEKRAAAISKVTKKTK
jgi:hypothetical protein